MDMLDVVDVVDMDGGGIKVRKVEEEREAAAAIYRFIVDVVDIEEV